MDINLIEHRAIKRKLADKSAVQIRPLDPQAWFRYWNGTECSLRDLNLAGAGIYMQETMAVGTPISIDILLDKNISPIRVFGKVEWSLKTADKFRAGIRFSWWKNDQKKKTVDSFLDKLEPAT